MAVALCMPVVAAAQLPVPQPPEVTDSAVARGRVVFDGPAACTSCHGRKGEGGPHAPALNDDRWITGSGTYEQIVQRVTHGVSRRESTRGEPMPVRGWSPGSDDDVKAVAAYVWWLAHRAPREPL
jgi:mono/diheme cytochrome c family protein